MVKIDLSDVDLFSDNEIVLDKRPVFIYGHNGTGKSTFGRIIESRLQSQCDVSVFRGFEKLIDEEKKLNAVLLGEENIKISKKIKSLDNSIHEIQKEADKIKREIEKPDDGSINYFTEFEKAQIKLKTKNKELEKFYSVSASDLKKRLAGDIVSYNYNKNNFSQDISRAKLLDDKEFINLNEMLRSEVKIAKKINFPTLDFELLQNEVNCLLDRTVKAAVIIPRLDGDKEKIEFARKGLKIHKKGEFCAFCGNIIKDEVYDELETLFTADDVEGFQKEIVNEITKLGILKENIQDVHIISECFYNDYVDKLNNLSIELCARQHKYNAWLDAAIKSLNEKLKNMFQPTVRMALAVPNNLSDIRDRYNSILRENNNKELLKEQQEAKAKLRYHYVKQCLNDFDYDNKKRDMDILVRDVETAQKRYEEKQDEYTAKKKAIEKLKNKIIELRAETVNQKILAEHINRRLKNMVPFILVYQEDEKYKGYYQIKDTVTGEIRDVTRLSTGEKNIIAFLYFIEKLDEIKNVYIGKPRVIVFDDPMNSNDDTMQYLIIEELQSLMNSKKYEHVVIMTHNKHFYINVRYGCKYKDGNFYRFQGNGNTTAINRINKEKDDFKTSYEEIWQELQYFSSILPDTKSAILINPIRRIIETYTKFNDIDSKTFYREMIGAKKLFNVNSHSIDDLEAELNGKNKKEIIQLMYDCFRNNGAEQHFIAHWKDMKVDESGKILWNDVVCS